jgi:hypothetical protein
VRMLVAALAAVGAQSFLGPVNRFARALSANRLSVRGGATAIAIADPNQKSKAACSTPKTFAELETSEAILSKFELISSEEVRFPARIANNPLKRPK